MDKKTILKLKEKLEKEKISLEKELEKFARKDKNLEGDWDTKYPRFNGGVGSQVLETAADEVEEFATLLPLEYNLELKLKEINLALEKIKKGIYGRCEKCGKKIALTRLKIFPEARTCRKCKTSKSPL